MHPLQFNNLIAESLNKGLRTLPTTTRYMGDCDYTWTLKGRPQRSHVPGKIPNQIFGTQLTDAQPWQHFTTKSQDRLKKSPVCPLNPHDMPPISGFGTSYHTLFVGILVVWNPHAFDTEVIGFQSWVVLAICRTSKPTVPRSWGSCLGQLGKHHVDGLFTTKPTWNWSLWGIPYFLSIQISNC